MNSQYDVVIVGGGIGGLAVAWNLTTQAKASGVAPPSIALVEASGRWGGNADTMQVNFGTGPGYPTAPGLTRWVDLGVNDFNTTAYTNIVGVMNTIGFKFGVDYKNLEDSTTYYTTDGSICFTDSASDVANSGTWWGTTIDPLLAASAASFMKTAGYDAVYNAQKYANYTIKRYIDERGKQVTPNWVDALGPQVIYPRINGMYFVSEMGPLDMPFLAVMHYYAIQEGAGGKPANRCYFSNGSSAWISQLTGYMQQNMPNIDFALNYPAVINKVATADPMFYCQDANQKQQPFKATQVVLAAHADDSLMVMKTGMPGSLGEIPAPVVSAMASIKYNNGISVGHLDSRLLPVDSNAWSAYNIVIHQPGAAGLSPYEINYVVNRHQNDAANPTYNKYGLPQYFVSCNPHRPVPEHMILRDINGDYCVANLRHNNFDFATMQAQTDVDKFQGVGNVYYAGGWTRGAGLHEECWIQGQDVAAAMLAHSAKGAPQGPAHGKEIGTLIGERLKQSAKAA